MNVRWIAVLTGFAVDLLISFVLALFARPEYLISPDFTHPDDLTLVCLSVVLTTVSGYVAGRRAQTDRVLNGLMVQVVSILLAQLGPPIPRPLVLVYAVACLFAALGGFLSRYPLRSPRSDGPQ